jgi:hypothetical protein
MGGRVYDPDVQQFLSPDPYVQMPDNTQNLNRYAYCLYSPTMYVDPTGESFLLLFAINAIAAHVRGENGWEAGWEAIANHFRILGGLFTTDKNKNFGKQTWELISRFTWQGIQTVIGHSFGQISNTFGGVSKVDYSNGATVLFSRWIGGGVALGSYITGGENFIEADPNNDLFQHEYGHYLQSQAMGPVYFSRVALPSLFGAMRDDHNFQVYEQDANLRAFMYFNETIDGFYQTREEYELNNSSGIRKGWDFYSNPLDLDHLKQRSIYYDYRNSTDLTSINSWRLKPEWYEYLWGILDPFSNALFIGSGNHIYNNSHRP